MSEITELQLTLSDIERSLTESKAWFSGDNKPKSAKIGKKDIRRINKALNKRGLDGNGRFRSSGEGYTRASEVLLQYGIQSDETVSINQSIKQGKRSIRLAFSTDDPFWPVSIKNSVLALSWFKLDDNKYEVLAYLS